MTYPLPSYESLVRSALDCMADSADMLDHLGTSPEAGFLAGLLV